MPAAPANAWKPCLADPDFRVRMDAALALAELGDARSIAAIERARAAELDGRVKRRFRNAVTQLREKGGASDKLHKLGEEVERLRGESTRCASAWRSSKPDLPARNPNGQGHVHRPAKRPRPGGHRTGRKTIKPRRR
jgi:hypothetical protein